MARAFLAVEALEHEHRQTHAHLCQIPREQTGHIDLLPNEFRVHDRLTTPQPPKVPDFHINEDFLDCLGYLDCTHVCSGKTNRTQQASLMRTIHKMSKS